MKKKKKRVLVFIFPLEDYTHTHTLSTIGDDGSRQYTSVAAILAAVFWKSLPKTVCVEHFSHESSILFTPKPFPCVLNLHKETTVCFPTIGDDGSRQCRSDAAIFTAVSPLKSKFCSLF